MALMPTAWRKWRAPPKHQASRWRLVSTADATEIRQYVDTLLPIPRAVPERYAASSTAFRACCYRLPALLLWMCPTSAISKAGARSIGRTAPALSTRAIASRSPSAKTPIAPSKSVGAELPGRPRCTSWELTGELGFNESANTISCQVEICRGELPGRPKKCATELTGEIGFNESAKYYLRSGRNL